MTIST